MNPGRCRGVEWLASYQTITRAVPDQPQLAERNTFMARTAILTREVLAGVPALVEQGLRKGDIAERLGCEESTLVVRCSIAGITLRGPRRLELRAGVPLTLSPRNYR